MEEEVEGAVPVVVQEEVQEEVQGVVSVVVQEAVQEAAEVGVAVVPVAEVIAPVIPSRPASPRSESVSE